MLRFLAGTSLLALDRPEEAAEELARAVELDPEDAEFRAGAALALFRACRFGEAAAQAREAVEADPRYAEARHVLGLTLEREGRFADADAGGQHGRETSERIRGRQHHGFLRCQRFAENLKTGQHPADVDGE